MKRVVLIALVLGLALGGVARAQDATGCDKFKWSIARERAWFAAGPKAIDSGAEVKLADEGYLVALVSNDSVGFAVPPERAPKAGTFGGVVKFAIDKPGLYEVTLSDEGWTDVVQNGARIKSSDFSGQKACPGVRKSVRFTLAAGPATLQISNVETGKIMVAIAPATPL